MPRLVLQTVLISLAGLLAITNVSNSFGQETTVAPNDPAAINPEAQSAKQSYDQFRQEWKQVIEQINHVQESGSADADQRLRKLRQRADTLLDQIVGAGLQVYQADANAYPKVNNMLVALAQFFIVGDAAGDGGDQFEQALPIIEALLDSGQGEQKPELWLWGAVSAFATNDYSLAKQYFDKAQQAGLLGDAPPWRGRNDPRNRAWQLGKSFVDLLDSYEGAWQQESKIRQAEAEADDLPRVKFTTAKGDIVIELFENEAPQAVANFITLVKSGFYDGLTFHRVLPGFMAQGGCPEGTGSGGPGYHIRCECYAPNARKHFRGSLSMAHAGRDTGGSQFFLTFVPTAFLNGKHTVFGRVIEGIDVASAIRRRDPEAGGPEPDKILHAEVIRDRGHEYKFEKLPGR